MIVTAPLPGYSLLGDDRRRLYFAARRFGSNPLEAASHAWDTLDGHRHATRLFDGAVRPDSLSHAFCRQPDQACPSSVILAHEWHL